MISSRREFLLTATILWQSAVARAQHSQSHTPAPANDYRFVFLDLGSRRILRVLMARIVPADGRSGGAVGAKVDEYIDYILTHAEAALQEQWRSGLQRYRSSIEGLDGSAVDSLLSTHAANEFQPLTEDERFFVLLKYAVTEGFYTSEEGIDKELGYRGMGFVLDFVGCTHARHEAPARWRPMLRRGV
jgi:Gluconate 2-dehydrogenase subunit 3